MPTIQKVSRKVLIIEAKVICVIGFDLYQYELATLSYSYLYLSVSILVVTVTKWYNT